jgi:hypothetical protein
VAVSSKHLATSTITAIFILVKPPEVRYKKPGDFAIESSSLFVVEAGFVIKPAHLF